LSYAEIHLSVIKNTQFDGKNENYALYLYNWYNSL